MDTMLLDHFIKLLDHHCTTQNIRAIEAGGQANEMWAAFVESGFLNALAAEEAGGFGLTLDDVSPLIYELGAYVVPLPVAETMVARALLGNSGSPLPDGPIVLADLSSGFDGFIPAATLATHICADLGDRLALFDIGQLDVDSPQIRGSWLASVRMPGTITPLIEVGRPSAGLRALAGIVRSAQIAGAARRILEMTIAYAQDRTQFGKPIGKQQAIQQNLSVMAEQAVMADMAAQIGCAVGLDPKIEVAATSKHVTSAAALDIANMAHAVHGAIGISEEFDLQLFTRRLHEWRMADGSESWWAGILGASRLANDVYSNIDYVRANSPA